jgi:hypothetical protein
MASRPGRVLEEIAVLFGIVRGPTVLRDARFLDLRDEIEDLLHPPSHSAVTAAGAAPE